MKFAQGDIIQVENLKGYFLVVSKDFFNAAQQAILCPVVTDTFLDPLHLPVHTDEVDGIIMCEQLRLFDLHIREWKKIDHLPMTDTINITDAVQSIFDY